ncbi:MAG: Clp protease N-terminal domain-containing protein, partial [Anaerolineales bacterium]
MDLEKYTTKSQQAVLRAQKLAEDHNHQEIEPAHLLYALLEESEGTVSAVVTRIAGSTAGIRDEVWKELEDHP